ncbi:MAG: UBP-type zinc finger domain-containing protein [Bacteroidota bacterium]
MPIKSCEHLDNLEPKHSDKYACEECVKIGATWVHLRTCQTCGKVLCCDSSPHKHATKHYKETGHPVVISAEPGEKWAWCYEHKLFMQYS